LVKLPMIAMESLLRLGSRGRPVRPRWRSWGREAIDPHRLRPQHSGGRRGETFLPREEWRVCAPGEESRSGAVAGRRSGRSPHLLAKSAHRKAGRAAPHPSREETVASSGKDDQGATVAPWREVSHRPRARMSDSVGGTARSDEGRDAGDRGGARSARVGLGGGARL